MKIEIVFDKEFTAVLTELAWSIGDSIKQAIINQNPIQQPTQPIPQPQPVQQPIPLSQPTPAPLPTQHTQPVSTQPVPQPTQPVPQPTQPVPQPIPQPTPVPTQKVVYNHQQLAVAAIQLKDAGKMNEIQDLIRKYGINSIMELKPEQFESFAQDLIAKGVKF